jgi:ribose transport system permease protein
MFFIVAYLLLKYTLIGRNIYAVGSNAKAAWLAGVNIKKTTFLAYVISGITGGATAVILTSRLASVVGSLGTGLELDVISAVVIGGTSLMGGAGTVLGSLVGALIIETVSNILTLARVSPFFTVFAKGLVLWLAVLIDMARKGYVFKKPGT